MRSYVLYTAHYMYSSQTLMGVIVTPLILLFILMPYFKWRREARVPVEANIEKSTLPAKRKAVKLSVIVPAYNETERLPAMLNEAIAVCHNFIQIYKLF